MLPWPLLVEYLDSCCNPPSGLISNQCDIRMTYRRAVRLLLLQDHHVLAGRHVDADAVDGDLDQILVLARILTLRLRGSLELGSCARRT